MKSREIFKCQILDKEFKDNGYVIVNLLDELTAKRLYQEVVNYDSGVQSHFYTSLWSKNEEYRKKVDGLIQEQIGKRISSYFNNYNPLFGDLLIKKPSLLKDFPIHQDWTFVDEEIYTSIYIWCALQDVNYLNGNLQIVEKSHQYLDKIRGANIQVSYESIKTKIQKKYLKNIPLKAGHAIIFNQALLHASPPNRSFKTRIALGLLMVPNEATIYHYYFNKNKNKIQRIIADKDFFMRYGELVDFQNALKENNFILNDSHKKENIFVEFKSMTMNDFTAKKNSTK